MMRKFLLGSIAKRVRCFSSGLSEPTGLVEIRQYTLQPRGIKDFIELTGEYASLRREFMPWLGMFVCDTGGVLNQVTHIYHYKDFDHRDRVRRMMAQHQEWQTEYIDYSRPCVAHQESRIMLHAKEVHEAVGAGSVSDFPAPSAPVPGAAPVVYEMRSYQLHPGYGSVPKVIALFKEGLPKKVAADPEGQLAFFGYTDVGLLNNVVELWRYPSAQACIRARQAARVVPEWREVIAQVTPMVQTFETKFLHPLPYSPWQ